MVSTPLITLRSFSDGQVSGQYRAAALEGHPYALQRPTFSGQNGDISCHAFRDHQALRSSLSPRHHNARSYAEMSVPSSPYPNMPITMT